jgi:GNAT superfamily N-acetyltransferase
VTRDPVHPAALRVRRFYVHPDLRRRGHGETLANAVLEHSRGHLLLVHSSEYAMRFWDDVGFARSTRPGITQERAL